MKKKIFRILSIDGGGILGLYSAKMIQMIKEEYLKDKDLHNFFNLVTGTSTGGIIALGIAAGSDIHKIVKFYEERGKDIFPSNVCSHRFYNIKMLFNSRYTHKKINKHASEFFGDKRLSDAKCFVCVPSIDAVNCQPILFKTDHSNKYSRDNNVLMKDIAIATSSAPTYFPLYSFGNYLGLVDGGLWNNNPSLIGFIEAMNNFVGKNNNFGSIEILSIGNPHSNLRIGLSSNSKRSSLLKWKSKLVELPLKISSIATDQIIRIMYESEKMNIDKYLRIASQNITNDQQKLYLDLADKKSIKLLLSMAENDFYTNKNKIKEFMEVKC